MLPNYPSERLPNTSSEQFRTAFRTVPRTHSILRMTRARLSESAAPDSWGPSDEG